MNAPRPESLCFMPALTLTQEEVDHLTAILDEIFSSMK
jgi:4-aminobutyrate aminotransferase-like enzyme